VCVCVVSRREQMRGARSVESLDTAGRPGPLADLGRSYDDQQLHDALSEQRVGPGPPTSRRQAPGRSTVLVLFVCLLACFSYGGQFQRTTSSSDSPLFLPRDAMHKCDLCRHAVSVCLSVCPSVCHVRGFCQNVIVSSDFFHHGVA